MANVSQEANDRQNHRFEVLAHCASGLIVATLLVEDRRSQNQIAWGFPAC